MGHSRRALDRRSQSRKAGGTRVTLEAISQVVGMLVFSPCKGTAKK